TTEGLIKFLSKQGLELDDDDFNIIRKQKLTGRRFLMLNGDKLMQDEQNAPLLESVYRGELVALHGPRASGKSTRMLQLQDQLNSKGFACIYLSLEQVNIQNVDKFWHTIGTHLHINAPKQIGLDSINSANDFDLAFKKDRWENFVVLLIDEFDRLYFATDDVHSSCLSTLRGIKITKECYAIKSVFAIGPFSILYLKNDFTVSPFNVNEPFQNPNFTMEQVEFLYKEFVDEYKLTIDQEVIEDIYTQTNRHAGLVCLCGRAIFRKLYSKLEKVNGKLHIGIDMWERFSMMSLGDEIIEYQTFIRIKDALLIDDPDTKRAVSFFRSDFLASFGPIYVTEKQRDLALLLTAEGVLIPGNDSGTFEISSPLVRWLILQRIIPRLFPTSPQTEVPYNPSTNTLDVPEVLKQVTCVFDKETIRSRNSFKIAQVLVGNVNHRNVPRESVYDAELYRIMSNWLGGFRITGQWYLKYRASGHINNKYVDIVISRPKHPTIVFELLATATKKELKEHYERALLYDKKLPADETWVIHFTCEENAILEPCWPTKSQLQKDLRVNTNNNTSHVTDVEEFVVRSITNNITLIACFTFHASNDLCSI
ncbi:6922_t:CDS:2, partial [Cetraspora pellucida]